MPLAELKRVELYYEETGVGVPVVFLHPLAHDHTLWKSQVEALQNLYRCVTLDLRGHGASSEGEQEQGGEGYTLEEMAQDVYGLIRHLNLGRAHFVGQSLGAMIILRLAVAHPQRMHSLSLLGGSLTAETPERAAYFEGLARRFRDEGPASVVDQLLPLFFRPSMAWERPEEFQRQRQYLLDLKNRQGIYRATLAVTRRKDFSGEAQAAISAPTLVLAGEQDVIFPPPVAQHLHQTMATSKLEMIRGAGHTLAVECPEVISSLLREFFATVAAAVAY